MVQLVTAVLQVAEGLSEEAPCTFGPFRLPTSYMKTSADTQVSYKCKAFTQPQQPRSTTGEIGKITEVTHAQAWGGCWQQAAQHAGL